MVAEEMVLCGNKAGRAEAGMELGSMRRNGVWCRSG